MSSSLESGDLKQQSRTALNVHGLALLTLSFQTIGMFLFVFSYSSSLTKHVGIIYSDIGTSPLYVLNGIWPASGDVPSREDVIGGVSAIIWALTLLPLLKYVVITLRFGTHEGIS